MSEQQEFKVEFTLAVSGSIVVYADDEDDATAEVEAKSLEDLVSDAETEEPDVTVGEVTLVPAVRVDMKALGYTWNPEAAKWEKA